MSSYTSTPVCICGFAAYTGAAISRMKWIWVAAGLMLFAVTGMSGKTSLICFDVIYV